RDGDIEFARSGAPLALLGTVIGLRGAIGAVERNLLHHRVGVGRDQTCKRRVVRIVGRHDEPVTWVEAHLVGSAGSAGRDYMGGLLTEQVDDLDRAVAIACPYFSVSDDDHPVRT